LINITRYYGTDAKHGWNEAAADYLSTLLKGPFRQMHENKCPVIPGAQQCLFTTSERGIELQEGIRIPVQAALAAKVDGKAEPGAASGLSTRADASRLPIPFLVGATETMLQVKWLGEHALTSLARARHFWLCFRESGEKGSD
jgi:hypothetical protein